MTGSFADDDELADVLTRAIKSYEPFQQREWYIKNSGYRNSTEKLNGALRAIAQARNENWTVDIVQKVNRPEVEYVNAADGASLAPAWKELEKYVCDLG